MDIAIIGSGPAGLTSAIYALRAGFRTSIFERSISGGQMNFTNEIENFPGFIKISGSELASKTFNQAKELGADFINLEVRQIEKKDTGFIIKTEKESFDAKNIIIATGAKHRELGLESEKRLRGSGVSYCATCDGAFFKDLSVCVVGGGNTAFGDAIYLSKICKKVYIIHRRKEFRADKILQERVKNIDNIEIITDSVVSDIKGNFEVQSIDIKNLVTNEAKEIKLEGVFVATGNLPNNSLIKELLNTDEAGYIITDNKMRTSIEGIYAVGDIRSGSIKQIITACADAVVAVNDINSK